MEVRKKRAWTIGGAVLLIAGLALVLSATNLGIQAADRAIWANDGVMDMEQYRFIMESSARSYQITGMVCALIGGVGALLSGVRR